MIRIKTVRIPGVIFFVLVLSATFFLLGLKQVQKAHAVQPTDCSQVPYNRCLNTGYFTNENRMSQSGVPGNQFPWPNWFGYTDSNGQSNSWAIPSNVDNNMPSTTAAENFISYTQAALANPYVGPPYVAVWETCSGCADYIHDPADTQRRLVTGAAFMVDTMLGRWGTDYGSGDAGITNGIAYARNNFGTWANMVRAFATAGRVNWNIVVTQSPHINTTSVGYGYSARDVNYFNFLTSEVSSMIWFYSPDGSIYKINRICLNVSGTANLLPPATIQGRIFRDDNNNGVWDGGEPIIQNGVDCTSAPSPRITNGAYVTVSGVSGSYPPQYCNNDPYYSVLVESPGNHTVSVVPPGGWQATSTNPVTVNVANGQVYNIWFGVRPLTGSCNINVNSGTPEQGQQFTVTVGITVGIAPVTNAPYTVTYTGASPAGLTYAGPQSVAGTLSSGNTTSSVNFTPFSGNTNQYTLNFSVSGISVPSCTGSVTIANKPYMRVYGGDVLAGGGFGACTPTTNSGIIGYNAGAQSFGGAGGQFAAQSTGAIYQFASAAQRANAASTKPGNGLSFANTGAGVDATWGGSFGTAVCSADYNSAVAVNDPGGNSIGGITVTPGGRYVIKRVGSDVVISNNIQYQTTGWTSTSVPSFYLVVIGGNIYIDKGVTNLDGVYIAQPNGGNGGTIYTCASGTTPIAPANLYLSAAAGGCNNKLTVNGAFVANQVKFLRTNGTLASASVFNSGPEASTSANIAEVFNYSPELWMAGGPIPSSGTKYDSITSLPPVL